ncbi:lipoprotein lipase-like [Episyrphus balteatus]|uniref:lipoprotein lipase-like n=1 Tax=Episyrphus balteatus TaxID=286459 RepID=UPI0024862011|nr:lipoprotein lipase-like [Episyrphus balteatus]
MKQHIFLAVAAVVVLGLTKGVLSFPAEQRETDTIWPIPQKNGSILWMTEEQALTEADDSPLEKKQTFDKIKFFLYTEANPTEPIEIIKDDLKSLVRSKFDFKNPTRFMIHGWMGGYDSGWSIREALLMNGTNKQYNFISVDWSVYSTSALYIPSQRKCSKAGKIVAEFIDWMHDQAKLSFDTLAVYGSSLGAHVAGFAGKNVKRGKIHTIVGLDPAMPLFQYKNTKKRLASTDAVYVETIQTNGGVLGFNEPIGKAAFYPNGGHYQPGCDVNDIFCSHIRAIEYFAEALSQGERNSFVALECSDLESMEKAACGKRLPLVRLGDPNNAKKAKGIYYLLTHSQAPYSILKF